MPSLTRCVCTDNSFIHKIYANHNLMAQTVLFVQGSNMCRDRQLEPPIEPVGQLVVLLFHSSDIYYRSTKTDSMPIFIGVRCVITCCLATIYI